MSKTHLYEGEKLIRQKYQKKHPDFQANKNQE